MIKIGITGSLASGKTTASKILSNKRGPLFSADEAVNQLYRNKKFRSIIIKKFKIKKNKNIKSSLRKLIFENRLNIQKLEKIIHPIVRKRTREVKPNVTPSICGMVFVIPKLNPEYEATTLLGPGV